jgi:anti-anti-sigma factor
VVLVTGREIPGSGVAVHKVTVNGLTFVAVAGELAGRAALAVRSALRRSPDSARPDLAVDLRHVTFLDRVALAVFAAAHKDVTAAGGCLRLVTEPGQELHVLDLCHLEDIACLHASVATATAIVCERHPQHPDVERPRGSGRSPAQRRAAPGSSAEGAPAAPVRQRVVPDAWTAPVRAVQPRFPGALNTGSISSQCTDMCLRA